MNEIQKKKVQSVEKAFPGCLGRMVNMLDLSNGFARNRQLTNKPHHDGSSLARSHSDVATSLAAAFGDWVEDKMVVSELRRSSSNKKASRIPIKTLIAEEMSKEVESNHNPANVVAKLMGLDTLPQLQPHLGGQKHRSIGLSRRSLSHSGIVTECWQEESYFLDKHIQFEGHLHHEQYQTQDACEAWQLSQKATTGTSQKQVGRHNQHTDEKKMALVREKFMQVKRLSTMEKGKQSNEFQDALEFLSSNKDALLKFLQESNSKFSQHLCDMKTISSPSKSKCITVLRPLKAIEDEIVAAPEKNSEKQIKKTGQISQALVSDKTNTRYSPILNDPRVDEYPAQPTQIVVLKPTSIKTNDVSDVVSPHSSLTKILHEDLCDESEDDKARESKEMAKEITYPMGHRRDETLLSSVFSNGYVGDDSSFNKSEIEYAVDNNSDSEVMSSTSRHSWDNVNRYGSPYSSSPFSRDSCSPKSSVCREAKKQLSERFAMMASKGNSQEITRCQRSSSTLGEMLALSDMKKLVVRMEEDAGKVELNPRASTSCSTSDLSKDGVVSSPITLPRSKSLPVSSKPYGRVNHEASESEANSNELTKTTSVRSSLRWKVSSLFFSRNKKTSKEKSDVSFSKDEPYSSVPKAPGFPIPFPQNVTEDASHSIDDINLHECFRPSLYESSFRTTNQELGVIFSEEKVLSVVEPVLLGSMSDNQEEPSPISVLKPPFTEEDDMTLESSGEKKPYGQGLEAPFKSNLIDKSPPIGSIARTLSWDDSYKDRTTSYSLNQSMITSAAEEENDCRTLVHTLLSVAGFTANTQHELSITRWHSLESPLDPSLREKYTNINDKELLHEAKRRQRRSNKKLVFDSVNAALMELTVHGLDWTRRACDRPDKRIIQEELRSQSQSPSSLVDHVWYQIKDWFSIEAKCSDSDSGDNGQLAEGLVKKEVVGRWWVEKVRIEFDNFGKEIERTLLEELVEEAVLDLTIRIC